MGIFGDRAHEAQRLSALVHTNPFSPERMTLEREILGPDASESEPVWTLDIGDDRERPHVAGLRQRAERLAAAARGQLVAGDAGTQRSRAEYEDLVLYTLYERIEDRMYRGLVDDTKVDWPSLLAELTADYEHALRPAWGAGLPARPVAEALALLWQLRRAFHFIHRRILGSSTAAAQLRATVWESVFTHDMARYRRGLFRRMHEIPTLVHGPSGTGKELVASAIGLSRFIPFDPERGAFEQDYRAQFMPVHLASLSSSLVEAELFGHEKGAFTGAAAARAGYLEGRSPAFTVFLDEIGEVAPELQVKLLRVLQSRTFQRVGSVDPRRFEGKVVAATHRDLPALIREGRFREDLYYRLCADQIRTPSLAEQLAGDADELDRLVQALVTRIVDPEDRDTLVASVVAFVEAELGLDYAWPGNIRELEQCIRNVLVRGRYAPARGAAAAGPRAQLGAEILSGTLTVEELLSRYATLVYANEGSFEGAARRLQIDRRTVKRRVDSALLEALRSEATP